jgi:hypothetical protein
MLYKIDTIESFRMRYIIEAKCESDALDELVMRSSGNDNDNFNEFSQKFLGELVVDSSEISFEELEKMNKALLLNNVEIGAPWKTNEEIIRKVNYE